MKTYDEPPKIHLHSQYNKTMATTTIIAIIKDLEKNPKIRFPDTYERKRFNDLMDELRIRGVKMK